jgi:hypothetical protein
MNCVIKSGLLLVLLTRISDASYSLGAVRVSDGPVIHNGYNKIGLGVSKLSNPCGTGTSFRSLPLLYSMEVCFSKDSTSSCDTLQLQVDTGSSDIWAITDECQKVSISPSPSPASSSSSCWPVQSWTTDEDCCASDFTCNRLTKGYYTDVQEDISALNDDGKKCYDDNCLIDSYAVGCTFGQTASAFVNITNNRSSNQQRRIGIVDYLADMTESDVVGIAGMSFSPLASFTSPVLIQDYEYFILMLKGPDDGDSFMYLNIGKDDLNLTSSSSGETMSFYSTNVVPYGGYITYWLIAMPEMTINGQNICDGKGCGAVVDSGTSLWTVPTAMWADFLEAILPTSCTGTLTSPSLGLITCPNTDYSDFPTIRFWFSSDADSGKGVYANFTAEQYMVCGTPTITYGNCEGSISTCVLLAEQLQVVEAYGDMDNVFILGDTFLVDRAVIFDIENRQIDFPCSEFEGCISEAPLTWFQRLWREWSILIIVGIISFILIVTLLLILARICECLCFSNTKRMRRGQYFQNRATVVDQFPDDNDESEVSYRPIN